MNVSQDSTAVNLLYKILGPNREPVHGGAGQWPAPGEWTAPLTGPIEPCRRGYHLCEPADLPRWLTRDAVVWSVEYDGRAIRHEDNKTVVGRARLVEPIGVLSHRLLVAWAADCAERVLPRFETQRPSDGRPRAALSAARRCLIGDASFETVKAAAAAAWATAWATADAAGYAAWAGYATAWAAADAAGYAAWAGYATAWAAAGTAGVAGGTKRREERQWQGNRLLQYLRGEIAIPGGEVQA